MGLDTVELVMEVEESFVIKIPDDDAQRIVTVGTNPIEVTQRTIKQKVLPYQFATQLML